MSSERIVFSMVVGWVVLVAVLILLDWLANPNRGGFRPTGERPPRNRDARREARRRRRLEDDASVRAALRDAYGASSLRLSWSRDHETQARALDDSLVRPDDEHAQVVDTRGREVEGLQRRVVAGDPLPNPEELPSDEPDEPADPDDEAERPVGWRPGVDPLALTARGDEPSPSTVRARVWKNHADEAPWDDDTLDRLRAGRPPTRVNPVTGRTERATVDVETGRATWGSEPDDPFTDPDDTTTAPDDPPGERS